MSITNIIIIGIVAIIVVLIIQSLRIVRLTQIVFEDEDVNYLTVFFDTLCNPDHRETDGAILGVLEYYWLLISGQYYKNLLSFSSKLDSMSNEERASFNNVLDEISSITEEYITPNIMIPTAKQVSTYEEYKAEAVRKCELIREGVNNSRLEIYLVSSFLLCCKRNNIDPDKGLEYLENLAPTMCKSFIEEQIELYRTPV